MALRCLAKFTPCNQYPSCTIACLDSIETLDDCRTKDNAKSLDRPCSCGFSSSSDDLDTELHFHSIWACAITECSTKEDLGAFWSTYKQHCAKNGYSVADSIRPPRAFGVPQLSAAFLVHVWKIINNRQHRSNLSRLFLIPHLLPQYLG